MLFQEIEYFMMVSECLNFSAAAEKLFISQPGLSKVIANLERTLGTKLFERSTRKVELTEAGRRFYNLSKSYLEQCKSLSQNNLPESAVGSLTIGFGNVVDTTYMPTIITAFQSKYPGITISTLLQNAEVMLKNIESRNVDLGLISSFAIPEKGYRSLLLRRCKLQAVVCKDHPLAQRKVIKLSDLKDENFIFLQRSINRGCDKLVELCKKAGFLPNVVEYANDFRLMFMMCSQKKGISFNLTMPDVSMYSELCSLNIDLSEYPETEASAGIAIVWLEKCINPALPLFLQSVETMCASYAAPPGKQGTPEL